MREGERREGFFFEWCISIKDGLCIIITINNDNDNNSNSNSSMIVIIMMIKSF